MIAVLENSWMTISQAAELAGCSTQYIRLLAKKKQIKAEKVGAIWMVDRKHAESLADKPHTVGRPRRGKKDE
jgi:excisionase family DNA binding protein